MQGLGVVVIDKRDGVIGNDGNKRTIENAAHVKTTALFRRVVEAVVKGDIEKHQLLVDEFEIALQGLKIGVPIFRYDEKIGVNSLAHMADPVAEEPCRNMFRGIQTEAVHLTCSESQRPQYLSSS